MRRILGFQTKVFKALFIVFFSAFVCTFSTESMAGHKEPTAPPPTAQEIADMLVGMALNTDMDPRFLAYLAQNAGRALKSHNQALRELKELETHPPFTSQTTVAEKKHYFDGVEKRRMLLLFGDPATQNFTDVNIHMNYRDAFDQTGKSTEAPADVEHVTPPPKFDITDGINSESAALGAPVLDGGNPGGDPVKEGDGSPPASTPDSAPPKGMQGDRCPHE